MAREPRRARTIRDRLAVMTRKGGDAGFAVAVAIPELAVVELTHELGGHPCGAIGVVVATDPAHDAYSIEMVDQTGRTTGVLVARGEDLRVTDMV